MGCLQRRGVARRFFAAQPVAKSMANKDLFDALGGGQLLHELDRATDVPFDALVADELDAAANVGRHAR